MGPKKKLEIRHEKCIKNVVFFFSYTLQLSKLCFEYRGKFTITFFAALAILTTGTTC